MSLLTLELTPLVLWLTSMVDAAAWSVVVCGAIIMSMDEVLQKKKTPCRNELTPSPSRPMTTTAAGSTTVATVAVNSRGRLAVNGGTGGNGITMVGKFCASWN